MILKLYELFLRTLNAPYNSTPNGIDYYLERKKDTLFIFFEKTDSQSDWKLNLRFLAMPYIRDGRICFFAHAGFLSAWSSVSGIIEKEIGDMSIQKIICSGYSHGAALAMLCHEFIIHKRPDISDNTESYGFGAPRVLWGIAAKGLKRLWERYSFIYNVDDIVTHMPPALLGYRHVGKRITVGKKGKYSKVDAHKEKNILRELAEI